MEGDYAITDDQITVTADNMVDTTAYHMTITPDTALSLASNADRYEAEYADISGSAKITHGDHSGYSGTGFVEGYGSNDHASTAFVVTASNNGFYNVKLRYSAGPMHSASSTRTIQMVLNGSLRKDVSVLSTADWNTWADAEISVFLTSGINRIAFTSLTHNDSSAIHIDCIEVMPASGAIDAYEAEAVGNTLGGTATVMNDPAASGGQYVGPIQFSNGLAPAPNIDKIEIASR
jgi:hypothetical protein